MTEQTGLPTHAFGVEEIIAELDREYTGILPERALRAAQQRRKEITPHLIDLIQRATETARAGHVPEGNGHLFALFLLTEFQVKEALPAILEAVSLPGELPFDLFGDAITEDLSRVFAALAADTLDEIDRLIENRSLNEYVRWEAAQAYRCLVRDGVLTRDAAVERLREHLVDAIANGDADGANGLVAELEHYAPREAIDEIREAYRRGLVDESLIDLETVERDSAEGESWFQKELQRCPPTGVRDTVEELRSWAAFNEDQRTELLAAVEDGLGDELNEESWAPATTAQPISRRVGRNEPCPCGSGKKYKKCCGIR